MFTQNVEASNIHFVVWQFWGRAAEASWTEKSRTLFFLHPGFADRRESSLALPLVGGSFSGQFGHLSTLSLRSPAVGAISANLQPRHNDPEPAVLFHLRLQLLKNIADEFHDLAATQARHVDVIAVQFTFVVMPLAVNVHQVEFVDQPLAL